MFTGLKYNENGLMPGNNFSNTTYSDATISINDKSRNWTIVGGNLGETIIGEEQNNLITIMNVNTSDVSFRQTITDNIACRERFAGPGTFPSFFPFRVKNIAKSTAGKTG